MCWILAAIILVLVSSAGCRTAAHVAPAFPAKTASVQHGVYRDNIASSESQFKPNSVPTSLNPVAQSAVDTIAAAAASEVQLASSHVEVPATPQADLPSAEFDQAKKSGNGGLVAAAPEIPEEKKSASELVATAAQQIDLTTALLLTSGQNPQVVLARARIQESQAQLDRALAMKLPSIRAGVNYNKHEGRIQDVAGKVIETSRGSFYHGFGANAVGAGSPATPGVVSQFHLTDAIFLPKIAQRTVCARQSGAQAATNDALLATAMAYMELLRSQQDLAIARQVVEQAERLERATDEFARAGEGLASDHDRARTELALRKNELLRAEEAAQVASVRLAEQIRWDCTTQLIPVETHLLPISMMDLHTSPRELVAMALTNRPDLAESRHWVGEAVERLNRESHAPLVPSILLSASYGGLGGGLGSSLSNYGDRFDADAVAVWEVRQLGVGEQTLRREARARIQQARQREIAIMDRVAREVLEFYTQATSRFQQIHIAEQAVAAAQESYEKNWDRIQNRHGLPIEVLQSIQASAIARREYVRAVTDYNVAQFSLFRALGWPVSTPETNT